MTWVLSQLENGDELPSCFLGRRRLGCPLPCAIRLRTQRPDHMAVAKTVLIRQLVNTPAEGASDFHLATRADVQSMSALPPKADIRRHGCLPGSLSESSWLAGEP